MINSFWVNAGALMDCYAHKTNVRLWCVRWGVLSSVFVACTTFDNVSSRLKHQSTDWQALHSCHLCQSCRSCHWCRSRHCWRSYQCWCSHQVAEDEEDVACDPNIFAIPGLIWADRLVVAVEMVHLVVFLNYVFLPDGWPVLTSFQNSLLAALKSPSVRRFRLNGIVDQRAICVRSTLTFAVLLLLLRLSLSNFRIATVLVRTYHRENKFDQNAFTIHVHFGSVVQVLTNFSVLVSFHFHVALYFL